LEIAHAELRAQIAEAEVARLREELQALPRRIPASDLEALKTERKLIADTMKMTAYQVAILKLASQGQIIEQPSDLWRDPFVFEFRKKNGKAHRPTERTDAMIASKQCLGYQRLGISAPANPARFRKRNQTVRESFGPARSQRIPSSGFAASAESAKKGGCLFSWVTDFLKHDFFSTSYWTDIPKLVPAKEVM
jgi:hypothetical protein